MLPIVVIAAAATVVGQPVAEARADITTAMTQSAAGWNAGDLDRFVAVYGDDAMFVVPKGVLRSKAEIADHYRPSFVAGGNKRGALKFQMLAWRTISNVHQLLVARWTLTPADAAAKPETGMTTLLFERRKDGWRIISDHSS